MFTTVMRLMHSCSYAFALHRKPLEMWDVTADCRMSFPHRDQDIWSLICCVTCSESAEIIQRRLALSSHFTLFRHREQIQSCATSLGRRSPSLRRARAKSFPWSRPWRSTRPPWRTAWPQSDCSSSEDKTDVRTNAKQTKKKTKHPAVFCFHQIDEFNLLFYHLYEIDFFFVACATEEMFCCKKKK